MSSPISQGVWEEQIRLDYQSDSITRPLMAGMAEQVDPSKHLDMFVWMGPDMGKVNNGGQSVTIC